LKKPIGVLWNDNISENIERLAQFIRSQKPECYATVGDFVSSNILNSGLDPDLVVVDHRIMRKSIEPVEFERESICVPNPPGTISAKAQRIIYEAIQRCQTLAVIVDGEEDLLVLPLMVHMPLGSVIIYGQPSEGMVVVTLTEERKDWATQFMNEMPREAVCPCDNP
jgi:uncharacterized protein (UPF0218 family)